MKKITLIFLLFAAVTVGNRADAADDSPVSGAWTYTDGNNVTHLAVFVDGYFSHSRYDLAGKRFISTRGGTYETSGNAIKVVWQYDTEKAAASAPLDNWLGKSEDFDVAMTSAGLRANISGNPQIWSLIDRNEGSLAGVWRISGRKQGDELRTMPLRDRRTLKILTGTRFQWVAINVATGEFSGTGGGTYTFQDGKYTENIEFFSRDNSRVGASLVFDGKTEDGHWHHSGLSSTGNPIYEIWSKLED